MSNFDPITILKMENAQLREEIIHYKGENTDLRKRIQNFEDEIRVFKKKLRSCISKPSGGNLKGE